MLAARHSEQQKLWLREQHVPVVSFTGGVVAPFQPATVGFDLQEMAQAEIENDSILARNAQVARPVAVRYAWASNPVGNLTNGSGLPASPFRTDGWDQ